MNTIPINEKYHWVCNAFIPHPKGCLFGERAFFDLHKGSVSDCYMQLIGAADQKVYASIAFYHQDDDRFVSPKRGTYGGLMLYEALSVAVMTRFFELTLDYLQTFQPSQIYIKLAPVSHDLNLSAVSVNILARNGFLLDGYELNYDMRVDQRPLLERMSYGNRKRIKKCTQAGYLAECVGIERLARVYQVIAENRQRKGNSVSMTLSQLEQMAATFPDRMHLFAVWESSSRANMLASAVCFALTDEIFYVFYWGDVAQMEKMSPITLIADCIYAYCQRNAFKLLDVGISTVDGIPNDGLIHFKENLGFVASLKPAFIREYSDA